jgi:flagellar biosynthesis protein FlhF
MTATILKAPLREEASQVKEAVQIEASSLNTPFTESISSLSEVLSDHEVEPKLIEKIVGKIIERGGRNLKQEEVFGLAERVMNVLLGEPEPIKLKEDKKPYVAIFIGPTGVGKTTTLAKIAADFTLNRQKKVALITADTYRIAAVEQLRTYAEILNLPVTVVYSPSEIKEAVERLSDNDIILIDTAGRSHKNKTHFDELKALVSAANADETFLVMSCNTSRIAIREIIEYYAFIRNYKLLFTKLDESSVPGVILNARYMTGKPLSYTTAGQSVPDDLDIADAKQLVSSILGKGGI